MNEGFRNAPTQMLLYEGRTCMKNSGKITVCLICIMFVLSCISCSSPKIKDPLASISKDSGGSGVNSGASESPGNSGASESPGNSETSEPPVDAWAPLLTEEEAIAEFGLGSRKDTVGASLRARRCDGEFAYYRGEYSYAGVGKEETFSALLRYNMRTGTSEPACRDAACTHQNANCPFSKPEEIKNFFIDDGVLYYLRVKLKSNGKIDTSREGGLYSYNLKTLECKYLCPWEGCNSIYLDLYGDSLYYIQHEFHTKDNGYDRWVWSCDIATGKREQLFCFGDEKDTMFRGRYPVTIDEQGRFIFRNNLSEVMPIEVKDVTVVFEYAELKKNAELVTIGKEFTVCFDIVTLQGFLYANSKVYYPENAGEEVFTVTLNGQEMQIPVVRRAVRCVDMRTGEIQTVAENVSGGFKLGGKYLYYTPFKPEKIGSYVRATRGEIIQVNLETGEERVLKIDKNIEICGAGPVNFYYRGRLFTRIFDIPKDTGYDVEIDLSTGKYRKIVPELASILLS